MNVKKAPNGSDMVEPLYDVLGRVCTELLDVAVLIERLEPMLTNGRSTRYIESPENLRILQGIDLAVQKARGLADFLEGIGERLGAEHLINISTALNLITLEDMKRRLQADFQPDTVTETRQVVSGDLDFF